MTSEAVLHLGSVGLDLESVMGMSWAVLGVTGSGKSNTLAVIVEDLSPHVPFTILDPDGEYYGLKDRLPFLIVGGPRSEIDVSLDNAGTLAKAVYERGQSVILDVSDQSIEEAAKFLHAYLAALWDAARLARRPHFVVIEEASQFIPQGERSELQKLLKLYAIRGRKRGIGLLLGNQRSADISKDILTQARIGLYHHVSHVADMRILKDLIPWEGKEVEKVIRGLQPGQAVFVRGAQAEVVTMRLRHTYHAGATPGVSAQPPSLQAADASFVTELSRLLAVPDAAPDDAPEIERLRRLLADREARIKQLEADLETARKANLPVAATLSEKKVTAVPPQSKGGDRPAAPTPVALDAVAARRQASLAATQIKRQQNKLEAVCDVVSRQRAEMRIMLAYLLEHPEKWIEAKNVAVKFTYDAASFRRKVSSSLLNSAVMRDLVERLDREHVYRLPPDFNRQFPDLDKSVLMTRLRAACGVG